MKTMAFCFETSKVVFINSSFSTLFTYFRVRESLEKLERRFAIRIPISFFWIRIAFHLACSGVIFFFCGVGISVLLFEIELNSGFSGREGMWRMISTGSVDVIRVSESSPDSAETSFRKLDDVFLQTQTRIWLGEVLHLRFDENVGISDLLADGELLFQVSKVVWKMLLRNHGELKHSKVHIYERTSSGKFDCRYMPYPKVDSFLKICQILGLTSIDLFSPSDVVEQRDIRRVCMCVRSLSKKARSKKLNVPDFDIVTYTISMPTHLVGGIRRNLELSWCSPSILSNPWNDAREICGLHNQHCDSRSDESVSSLSDPKIESPFSSASYDVTNITCMVGETSSELSSIVDDFVDKISFNNSNEDHNHYESVHENQDEMFSESISSFDLSTSETSITRNNKAMRNIFYYMETSDDSNSVKHISYSLDTEDGHDGNLSNKIKSPSIHDLNSLDNYACGSELEGSDSSIVCRNVHSFFSSFVDMQNDYSGSLVCHQSERNENDLVHTCLSSLENDCVVPCQPDNPDYLVKRKCGSQSSNPSVSDNCIQENDACKANFLTVLNEASMSNLVPVVQEDVDFEAHRVSLEKGEICDEATHRSFEGEFMSSCLDSGTKVGSIIEKVEQVDATYQLCQKQEIPQVVVKRNLSKESCLHYNFHTLDSVCENKMSKCALELIKNHDSSSNSSGWNDYCCIFHLMVHGSSNSHLPCLDTTVSEQQRISEEEDSVEHTNGIFHGDISSVNDSNCSDEVRMHQSFHDAADIAFSLSDYESKIRPSRKDPVMNVTDEESSFNRWNCQYDDDEMGDFMHQMTEKITELYTKDLDVLDVMEYSDFASASCASEMIPSFDFYRSDLFQSHIIPSSTSASREGEEVASDESIEVEKHVVSYMHDACTNPSNASQDKLVNTIFEDSTMPDKCGKSKDRESRAVRKTENQVLKSVAGVITMVGAFVLFLHVRQKDKEKKNEKRMAFQIQKPNKEFFTTRKIKIGKSNSLYPGEKLKF